MAFIRKKTKKSGTYLRMAESYRDADGKSRHRTLYNLGKAQDYSPESLKKMGQVLYELGGGPVEELESQQLKEKGRYYYGFPLIVRKLLKEYSLDIPFGALVNRRSDDDFKYAIEDFNIGYLSSMYLFNLIHDFKPSTSTKSVIFADPDFSLPGAKEEALQIQGILATDLVFTGKKASLQNFNKNIKGSKIVHLATHGHLDSKSLADSWLLFAGGKRYNMVDDFNLPLDQTELIVLSAC